MAHFKSRSEIQKLLRFSQKRQTNQVSTVLHFVILYFKITCKFLVHIEIFDEMEIC